MSDIPIDPPTTGEPPQAGVPQHGHSTHGHPKLAHHFDNMDQQRASATLGMWAFLAQEVMFFAALFLALTVYRFMYSEAFIEGSKELKWYLGTINTAVL